MARNNNKMTRRRKVEPAVESLFFTLVPNGPQTIDLSQCASLMNRRFYRQGINWVVAGIKILTGTSGTITVSKLPNTWVMSNAWEKGFRAWMKMNKEALAESESVKPKFLDFKIYADNAHHTAGFGSNLLPVSSTLAVATAGEWEPSKFVIPDTNDGAVGGIDNREVIAVGASYPGAGASGINAVSLIEGYAASRGLPDVLDPNVPGDAADADGGTPENWMSALFNEGTQQTDVVLEDMISENNIAPYPFENDGVNVDTMYPNGANQLSGLQIHDIDSVTPTTIGGITRLKGGNFPCGLIRVDFDGEGTYGLQIDLVPGHHRGYLCEPMTEM